MHTDQDFTDRLLRRLEELRSEHANGTQQLAALDARREELRTTMLRIEGAIQVLEEQVGEGAAPATGDLDPAGPG